MKERRRRNLVEREVVKGLEVRWSKGVWEKEVAGDPQGT